MDVFQDRYYSLNRLLLNVIGLWPYGRRLYRILKISFAVSVLTFGSGGMIVHLFVTECTLPFVSGLIQLLVPASLILFNILYLYFNSAKVKSAYITFTQLFCLIRMCVEHIRDDWSLHDEADLEIMRRYAEISRLCTLLTTIICSAFAATQIFKLAYQSDDDGKSGAESDEIDTPEIIPLLYVPEYRNYVICTCTLLVFVTCTSLLSMACLLCGSSIHAYGMFYIVGRRFETIFDNIRQDVFVCDGGNRFSEFFRLIFFHARVLKFVGIINSLYGPMCVTEIGIVIGVLSCDIFVMFQTYGRDINLFVSTVANLIGLLIATFICSFLGQLLIDKSTGILEKVYASQWYLLPPNIRRTIAIIMARSQMECGLFLTKSFTASYEMFLGIMKVSLSYFMTLKSLDG